MSTTDTFKDFPASLITSGYKWLTSTLLAAQQAFAVRPHFTCQIIDDTIQPNAQLFSGSGNPMARGSMATAPDGTVFALGLDSSNNLVVWRAPDLNAVAVVWPSSTIIDTVAGGHAYVDSHNNYSISISQAYNGKYRICVWYIGNFTNNGTQLKVFLQYSDDGGLTFTALNGIPMNNYLNNALGNVSVAAMTPVFNGSTMQMGCFYIQPNTGSFSASGVTYTGYDIYYIYGNSGGFTSNVLWYQNANSFDWTIHSLSAYYLNGLNYCCFSGFRNIIDTPGVNANYSLWVTSVLKISGQSTADQWSVPVPILPIASASSTNQNSFVYPAVTVSSGMVYVTTYATTVDSLSQTSQGASAQVVVTNPSTILLKSDDGLHFSYPAPLVSTAGVQFSVGAASSFVPQAGFWYLGGANGYLWQYVQNNVVADVTADVIGYNISETAGQPSAITLQIANQNNQWVGSAPTNPGASAIQRNRKIALWQGYYNANGVPEAVPHTVYFIDDIQQTVTSTNSDVTLVGRDLYKQLKTTVTRYTYQFSGPTFFTDIFDGTFLSSWNQIAGQWSFVSTINPPLLELDVGSGGEDTIVLNGTNGSSYGALSRVFFRYATAVGAKAYFYGMYIDSNNWLRLELDCHDGQSWAVVKNVAGTPSTIDSGTMPFTMSTSGVHYYGIYIRRYDYYKWQFMISDLGTTGVGNELNHYNPSNTSYLFKNGGTGEYDLSGTFTSSGSWQVPFTVGLGRNVNGPTQFRFFTLSLYTMSNNLGSVIRRIARIAGIFTFKLTYAWRELLFIPSFTGTGSVKNRRLNVAAGNSVFFTGNAMSNGEISFQAKIAIASTSSDAGFSFGFRNSPDPSGFADYYKLHTVANGTGFNNPPVYSRFERFLLNTNITYLFYNSGYDVSNNPLSGNGAPGSLNIDLTQWHTYRIVMIDGWFWAFIDDAMVAAWNDNNVTVDYQTTGTWGFLCDANTTLQVRDIVAPDFWKPVQSFSFNPGDDTESAIESLIQSLRAWFFSDLFGRFKSVFLGASDPADYTYNTQLFEQDVDQSDKEYVSQVTVYGNGVIATARNTSISPGAITREMVIQDNTITTQQDAQTRADNELINASQYLNQYTPKQVINVGSEMFDPVDVVNTGNNTSGVNGATRVYAQTFSAGGGNNNTDYSLQLSTGDL